MLYQQEEHSTALDIGIIALESLYSADVTSAPFALYSTIYPMLRGPKVAVRELLGSPFLSAKHRRELKRLVAAYVRNRGGKETLVHGDLQAGHLIVNRTKKSLGFIDLEAMCIGKEATNFAQLWIGYHIADRLLGQRFYRRYAEQFSELLNEQFDADVRAEIALRSYSHIEQGIRLGNKKLEGEARILLASVLSGATFEEICLGEGLVGNAESILR
jgi:hypothetical protein